MKTVRQNLSKALLVGLFMFSLIMIALQGSSAATVAVAAETGNVYAYDNTDVMDDLNGSDGFDIKDYPANANGVYEIFTFLEYGYSKNWTQYGLYLYVYNPQQKEISRSSASNKANVAVAYNDDGDASSYQRFEMKFCSASADGLFYKFRILDPSNVILDTARKYAANNGGTRRYYIADAELFAYGETLATATKIGKRYDCTGYMKGFGDDKNVNTFDCVAHSYDVLDIELKHTFFRPEGNSSATSAYTVKDQLDSVYFSFPNNLIEHYGGIWKIAASYYHAQTSPIFVTSTKAVYDVVKQYIGQELEQNNNKQGKDEKLNNNIPFVLYDVTYSDDILAPLRPVNCRLDWNHNAKVNPISKDQQILYYVFYTGNETSDGSVPDAKDFTLSGERLLEYIYNYNSSYRFGESELENGKQQHLSMDLFQGYLETGETTEWFGQNVKISENGRIYYVPVEITAEDNYTIESYKRTPTAFDWFTLYKGKYNYERFSNIQAIEPIDEKDVNLSKDEFCKKYYVDASAYEGIINQIRSGKGKETVYLFRFAQSTYTAKGVLTKGAETLGEEYAYVAEQDVYLNMNLASITCKKGDDYHTFAVCSNPINAVADVEPNKPYDNGQWYKDLGNKIKTWFEDHATALITTVVVIVCIAIVIVIVVVSVNTAPYSAMRAMAKAQSPPKKRQPQKRKTPNKNAAQKTRAGRSKKK